MGQSLYVPEWQTATPRSFKSRNPLFEDVPIVLDVYDVQVEERNKLGEKIGEHKETCVTHTSLMRWYEMNGLMFGYKLSYEPVIGKDAVIVKCTIQKRVTEEEAKKMLKAGHNVPMSSYTVHWEGIGEASPQNTSTEIAQKHLAATAENRAFDRTLLRLLALDTEHGVLYSSSDEIGRPIIDENRQTPESNDNPRWWESGAVMADPIKPAEQTPVTPRPVAPSSFVEKTDKLPVQTVPVEANADELPLFPEAKSDPVPPAQEETEKRASEKKPVTEEEYKRIASIKELTDEEAEAVGNYTLHLANSEFNGQPFSRAIEAVRHQDTKEAAAAGRALYFFVRNRPSNPEKEKEWVQVIALLKKEQLLHGSYSQEKCSVWIRPPYKKGVV